MHVWRAKGLPEPSQWLDTLPHARAGGLPGGLDELGVRLIGKGKDKAGAALVKKLSRPDKQGRFHPLTAQNIKKLVRYNLIDVLLLGKVYETAFGCGEADVIKLDQVINDRGVQFDVDLAKKLIALEAADLAKIREGVERLTGGAVQGKDLRRNKFLLKWLEKQGVTLPNLQQTTVQRYLAENQDASDAVRCVLNARVASNRITTGKLESALVSCDDDGRLRHMLTYHKAQTGRWAGRKVQPHNLPRPHKNIKDVAPLIAAAHDLAQFRSVLPDKVSVADGISALVRPTLRAGPGKVLCASDFASIEARGLAWIADQKDLLERFSRGDDVYLELASRIFGKPLTSADKMERNVGKQGILGCGYSMGAPKFAKTCATQGIDLAAAGTTAEAVVENYRDAYPAIAGIKPEGKTWREGGLWRDLEAAAKTAILTGIPQVAGRCRLSFDGATLAIQLPSGRRLLYRNARIENQVPAYCAKLGLEPRPKPTILYDHPKLGTQSTYGGKLTENIVQAISRDLLVEALRECERQGLPVVLHVHDEIVIEVPEAEAEPALEKLAVIMSTPPAWASGFPIEVEGFAAERYLKSAPKGARVVKARAGRILE